MTTGTWPSARSVTPRVTPRSECRIMCAVVAETPRSATSMAVPKRTPERSVLQGHTRTRQSSRLSRRADHSSQACADTSGPFPFAPSWTDDRRNVRYDRSKDRAIRYRPQTATTTPATTSTPSIRRIPTRLRDHPGLHRRRGPRRHDLMLPLLPKPRRPRTHAMIQRIHIRVDDRRHVQSD